MLNVAFVSSKSVGGGMPPTGAVYAVEELDGEKVADVGGRAMGLLDVFGTGCLFLPLLIAEVFLCPVLWSSVRSSTAVVTGGGNGCPIGAP